MDSKPFRTFISHCSTELKFVRELRHELAKLAITAYVATDEIPATSDWAEELYASLKSCDALVALVSPGFRGSEWTAQEVGFAMGANKPLVAVAFGATPFGFLGRLQAIKGIGRPASDLAQDIFQGLCFDTRSRVRLSEAIATSFLESGSYLEARSRANLLRKIPQLDANVLTFAIAGLRSNSFARDAEGVREVLAELASGCPQASELLLQLSAADAGH